MVDSDNLLISQVQLPNGKIICTNNSNFNYEDMKSYLGEFFLFVYSNGEKKEAKLTYVGYTEDREPFFSYELIEEKK